jgi:hypothetical protein
MDTSSLSHQKIISKECDISSRRFLHGLWSVLWSAVCSSLQLPILHLRHLLALPAVQHGLSALDELISNRRLLVGLGLGMVGAGSIFAHLLFPESARNYNWYYRNNYYLFFTLRPWLAIIFFSTAKFLCVPVKWKSHWVVYGLAVSVGIAGLIHYSFFVNDNISYHSFPVWYVMLFALGAGLGFIKAADYLVYRKSHLATRPFASLFGIIKAPNVDADTAIRHARTCVDEIENYNARV